MVDDKITSLLRVEIIAAEDLISADSNGFSDPYAIITAGAKKVTKEYSTPVVKKSLDPVWNTYFDFELNGVDTSKDIKIVVWDKDITRDDFLGMVTFDFGSIFKGNNGVGLGVPRHYFDPDNKAYWRTLEKRKAHENVSGKILVKFGIIDEADRDAKYCENLWNKISPPKCI